MVLYTVIRKGLILMKIIISNSSSVPIYEQKKSQIIEQIMNEELKEDDMLPSIRVLSKDIRISLMTIKKAYDQLEEEGYIKSITGKGTFVAPKNTLLALEQVKKDIEESMNRAIDLAIKYDIPKKEINDLIELLYRRDKNE